MLPDKYQWIESIGTLPKLITEGLKYLGLKELPGQASNPIIIQMAKDLNVNDIYTNDDISWCAVFICHLCRVTGKPQPFTGYEVLRAASFAKWGNDVARGEEQLGDILVFKRPGGNHVGLYIAESKDTYHVLGGNQSNAVTITEIAKIRLTAARRFYATQAPASAKKYFIGSSGKLSTNEA